MVDIESSDLVFMKIELENNFEGRWKVGWVTNPRINYTMVRLLICSLGDQCSSYDLFVGTLTLPQDPILAGVSYSALDKEVDIIMVAFLWIRMSWWESQERQSS